MADVDIKLGPKVYNLRPTFGAMREIEAATGSSCATLLQLMARMELHVEEMAKIVYHGAAAAGHSFDLEAVGKRLFDEGVGTSAIRQPIAEFLAELLYAPDTARKKSAGEWFRETDEITSQMFSLPPTPSDGDQGTSTGPLPESSGQSSRPSVKNPSA